ncbi:MAG: hypothetical protein AAGB35_10020 [Pseudomonadota bacterium]
MIGRSYLVLFILIAIFIPNPAIAGGGGGGGGVAINWITAFAGIGRGNYMEGTEYPTVVIFQAMLTDTSQLKLNDHGEPLPHHLSPEERLKAKQMAVAIKDFLLDENNHKFKAFVNTTDTEEQNTVYSGLHTKLYNLHTGIQEE